MTIKPYWQGALDYIVDLDIKSYDDVWEAEAFHNIGQSIRLCCIDDEIAGFYLVDGVAKLGRIIKFAVKPSWRRQGIGTEMMNNLLRESWLLETLSVNVNEYNVVGQLFLKNNYFSMHRQIGDQDGKCNFIFTRPTGLQKGEV